MLKSYFLDYVIHKLSTGSIDERIVSNRLAEFKTICYNPLALREEDKSEKDINQQIQSQEKKGSRIQEADEHCGWPQSSQETAPKRP